MLFRFSIPSPMSADTNFLNFNGGDNIPTSWIFLSVCGTGSPGRWQECSPTAYSGLHPNTSEPIVTVRSALVGRALLEPFGSTLHNNAPIVGGCEIDCLSRALDSSS